MTAWAQLKARSCTASGEPVCIAASCGSHILLCCTLSYNWWSTVVCKLFRSWWSTASHSWYYTHPCTQFCKYLGTLFRMRWSTPACRRSHTWSHTRFRRPGHMLSHIWVYMKSHKMSYKLSDILFCILVDIPD